MLHIAMQRYKKKCTFANNSLRKLHEFAFFSDRIAYGLAYIRLTSAININFYAELFSLPGDAQGGVDTVQGGGGDATGIAGTFTTGVEIRVGE